MLHHEVTASKKERMKKPLFFHIIAALTVGLLVSGWSVSAFADQWYDYYIHAQRAAKEKAWTTAIPLFHKALEREPEPARRKKYGFRTIAYYPYFELGMAYLATGDFQQAHQYCEAAKQKGVAPQSVVNQCLKTTATFFQRFAQDPPPPLLGKQPAQAASLDVTPRIQIHSTIPAETQLDTLTIEGSAEAEHGIAEVKVSFENGGVTGIKTFVLPKRRRENFQTTIPLDMGTTTIRIEVQDPLGHLAEQTFTVVRLSGEARPGTVPEPTPVPVLPPPVKTQQPVPEPTQPPLPPTDLKPSITLFSTIPEETTNDRLEIQGIARDDHGIADVAIHVHLRGQKGLNIETPMTKTQDRFHTTVALEVGVNEITIEARDTSGQTTRQNLYVRRTALSPPVRVAQPESQSPFALQRPGQVYAVIIGIGSYKDTRIPHLQFTVNDAKGFYDILTDPEYGGIPKDHVKLLLDEEATDRNIKRAIGRWLSRQAKKEDTVLIYYSGHGAPEFSDTYWVTHNANIDDLYTTALNNDDISDMLDRISSERVVTFLDSCYSAATVKRRDKTRSLQTEIPWDKFSGRGRVAISASDGKQLSLELEEYRHGVFTYYLLEGLRGQADRNRDGVIDVEEIWNYVKYQVTDTARKAGNPQTPVLQGSLTAGIPLTFNLQFLREQQADQRRERQLDQLRNLFTQRKIGARQYNCAYKMLKSGTPDMWIEGLLAGDIDPDVFNESFQCQ